MTTTAHSNDSLPPQTPRDSDDWIELMDEGLEIRLKAKLVLSGEGPHSKTEVLVLSNGAVAVLARSGLTGEPELRFELFECVEDYALFHESSDAEMAALYEAVEAALRSE